jgi:hypothetical protein
MLWMDIWVHPYTIILVQVGIKFWKVGVWVRATGIVVSWLRLQAASVCIPHTYHIHTKCFSTLICCGRTYRSTLTLLYQCKWGWIHGTLRCGWGQMLLWCHGWGYKQLQTASHIHIICIQSVLATWYAVDGHIGAHLHCHTSASGAEFLESWDVGETKCCCGVMVEATNSFRRHSTPISYAYKVF